jgi:hypothetical protein
MQNPLMYRYATWTIDRQSERKIAVEMWFIKIMLPVAYKEHKTNDQVLSEANTYRKLINKIKHTVQVHRSLNACGRNGEFNDL